LNANLERFFLSLKSECLERMIFFGERSLRKAVGLWLEHYHTERNHQGLDNKLIEPSPEAGRATGEIECRERLGRPLELLLSPRRLSGVATSPPRAFPAAPPPRAGHGKPCFAFGEARRVPTKNRAADCRQPPISHRFSVRLSFLTTREFFDHMGTNSHHCGIRESSDLLPGLWTRPRESTEEAVPKVALVSCFCLLTSD
jgi:hypothetical protein